MRTGILCAICIATLFLAACDFNSETVSGNGNRKREARQVGNTARIVVMGDMDVFVEPGASSVEVEGDENILQFIETENRDGWLEIKTRDNVNIRSAIGVKVYVTSPEIREVKVAGSGNLTCNNKFSTSNNMSFSVTGSGNLTANINSPSVKASITGSGRITLEGETRNVDVRITGSGNYDSPNLKAESAFVKISGSGDANLFADVDLKASIAGSGDVKYRGKAAVDKDIAGSGSVVQIP